MARQESLLPITGPVADPTLAFMRGVYDGASTQFSLGGVAPRVVRKAADETVNNSATLQDDNHLLFPIGASEVWAGQLHVFVVGNATADFQCDIVAPAGATVVRSGMGQRPADSVVTVTAAAPMVFGAAATVGALIVSFSVANGATAGTVVFRWSQNVATVADTIVKAGSWLAASRAA